MPLQIIPLLWDAIANNCTVVRYRCKSLLVVGYPCKSLHCREIYHCKSLLDVRYHCKSLHCRETSMQIWDFIGCVISGKKWTLAVVINAWLCGYRRWTFVQWISRLHRWGWPGQITSTRRTIPRDSMEWSGRQPGMQTRKKSLLFLATLHYNWRSRHISTRFITDCDCSGIRLLDWFFFSCHSCFENFNQTVI